MPEDALIASGLVKRYGDLTAVGGIDLSVRRGECFGLLGPNGAGKTTTVELLLGLIDPDGGSIELLGTTWQRSGLRLRERLGVQLQESNFPDKLTVRETIELFASFYPEPLEPERVIEMVSLGEKAGARVRELSGGQKQRLSLACALAGDPEILFLDEPTTGLDPQARLEVWRVVARFRRAGGTVLLTTHYMEEAARLCDRVAIMDHGAVIALGTPSDLIASLGAEHVVELATAGPVDRGALEALEGVRAASEENGTLRLTVSEPHRAVPAILAALERQRADLTRLTTHHATLEDVFVALTGRHLRDG